MRPHRPGTALLLSLATLLPASCSSQQDAPASSAPASSATPSAASSATPSAASSPTPYASPSAAGATITISGFAYAVPASVRPGAQVTVVNEDQEAHTVTVDRGAVRLAVPPGATAVFVAPTAVGAHPVTCDLHGGMDAVLVVA